MARHYLLLHSISAETGYPLSIEASEIIIEASPFERTIIERLWPKIDYNALRQGALQLAPHCQDEVQKQALLQLPDVRPTELTDDLLQSLHHVLMDVHLIEGYLICPDTQRKFPVKDGIPNMLLQDDEI